MAAGARPIRHDGKEPERPTGSFGQARLTPLRELQLLEAYRAGGTGAQDALNELLRGYQRRVYSICLRMVRNHDDASELAQDSLIKVIEGLRGYTGKSKLSTWIIRIAMNCCLSHLRRQKLRAHESLDASQGGRGAGVSQGARPREIEGKSGFSGLQGTREQSPLQRIEQNQANQAIVAALDSLDDEMKSILVLRDLQDLDYQQLAEVLDIPIGTVKSRLFRARMALRQAMEARGEV